LKFQQNASQSDREVIRYIDETKRLLIEWINAKNKEISEIEEEILKIQTLWGWWAILEIEITHINDNK
jgi:hypothetical protein